MQQFGQEYFENTVYISFYHDSKVTAIFEEDYDIKRIIETLEILEHTKITKQKTLIIFDEVQNAPVVVESLKYFCEDAPEYAVVAAGGVWRRHPTVKLPPKSATKQLLFSSEQ